MRPHIVIKKHHLEPSFAKSFFKNPNGPKQDQHAGAPSNPEFQKHRGSSSIHTSHLLSDEGIATQVS